MLDKLRCCNRGSWPTDTGISPCNLLELRSRILKNVRLPMEGVIVPERPCEVRFRTVTLSLCLRLELTPGQWQNLVVAFHAARTPCCWFRLAFISWRIPSSGILLTAIADALGTIWGTYAKRSNRRIGNIDDTAKHGTICEFTMIEQAACQSSKHTLGCESVIASI